MEVCGARGTVNLSAGKERLPPIYDVRRKVNFFWVPWFTVSVCLRILRLLGQFS